MVRCLLVTLGIAALALGGCATADDDAAAPEYQDVRPGEVASLANGAEVRVTGTLFATPEATRLCEAVLESYPPQCGEPAVVLTGMTAGDVVGLSRPQEPGLAEVVWSDFPVSVLGTVAGGTVEVTAVDQTVFAARNDLVIVRLAFFPDPLAAGDAVVWALDATNRTNEPLELSFSSGQSAEVELGSEGEVVYRWGEDMLSTQALRSVTLVPGEPYGVALPGILTVEVGDYELGGWFLAEEIRTVVAGGEVRVP